MAFLLLLLVFLGLVFYCGSAVFCSTLFYWYDSLNSPCEDVPALTPNCRGKCVLFLLTLFGVVMKPAARFLSTLETITPARFRRAARPAGSSLPATPPVLLIHGLYHDASAWHFMRRTLEDAGFLRTQAINYRASGTCPEELIPEVENAVKELESRYPGEKPLLVGHSLGGLLIRAWLNEGHEQRIAGVLTLGTPHRGSKLGAFAPERLGKCLMPGYAFFSELERREKPRSIPCVSLACIADTLVLPQSSLVPPGPGWQFRLTPLSGHMGLLFLPGARRMAAWELTRMLPEA